MSDAFLGDVISCVGKFSVSSEKKCGERVLLAFNSMLKVSCQNSVLKAFFQVLTTFLINHGVAVSKLSCRCHAEGILNGSLHEMVTWGLPNCRDCVTSTAGAQQRRSWRISHKGEISRKDRKSG